MSFGLDLLAIIAALGAAVLAASCVRRPLYHSSSTHQHEDTRLWGLVAAIFVLTASYQLLAIQRLLDGQIRIAFDVIANHGPVIEYSFYAAIAMLVLMVASALYAWLGHSIGRNITAVFGTIVAVSALPLGLYTRALDAARSAAGIPELTGISLQVAGIVVGAAFVGVAAGVYRYRRATQSLWQSLWQSSWRRQLHDPRIDDPSGNAPGNTSGKTSGARNPRRPRPRLSLVRGR